LVSNTSGAKFADTNLINSWGVVVHDGHIWVNANGADLLIRYDLTGADSYDISFYDEKGTLLSGTIGATKVDPTGIVVNTSNGYLVTDGSTTKRSTFLISSESGDLFGYNKHVGGGNKAYRIYAGSALTPAPVYKGIAVNGEHIFATDFLNGNLDIFNDSYTPNKINLADHISKYGLVSPNFSSPFNVVAVGGLLYVLYAYKATALSTDDNGSGGSIDIHDDDGNFIKNFTTDSSLKSPWGLVATPKTFGCKHEDILVGNFGSGFINAYTLSGTLVGQVYSSVTDTPVMINGLWGMFSHCGKVYFAAGPGGEAGGLVGYLGNSQIGVYGCGAYGQCDSASSCSGPVVICYDPCEKPKHCKPYVCARPSKFLAGTTPYGSRLDWF